MEFDAADEALTRDRSELEVLFADKLPAHLIGSSVGLIVGGPVGAVVGAAAAPLVEYLLNKGNQRYVGNAQRMLVGAADLAGRSVDQLGVYVGGSADRQAAAVSAVQAAADTLYEAKVTALARVLAYGLADDARLEMAAVYLRALRDLEAYHVRVLAHLDVRRRAVHTDREALVGSEDLEAEMPGLADGMAPILAVLEREALVYSGVVDGGGAEYEGTFTIGRYVITPFGQRVLAWLSSSAKSSA